MGLSPEFHPSVGVLLGIDGNLFVSPLEILLLGNAV